MKREIFSYVRLVVIAFVIAFVLKEYVIVNAVIPSGSMEHTINTGSRVIGLRLSYLFSDPQRGDIVIFEFPVDEDTLYIKRVIGVGGDTVEIRDAEIYVNGEVIEEPYLPEEWVKENDGYVFEVPEGHYLMLGDNRNVSIDARYWPRQALLAEVTDSAEEAAEYAYVSDDEVVAKAVLVYWPLSEWKLLLNK